MAKRSSRRRIVVGSIAGAVVLCLAGGGIAFAATYRAAPNYRTAAAAIGSVEQTESLSGTVESATRADAAFQVSGTVASVAVKVGQKVSAGDELATLDDSSLQNSVDQAEQSVDSAKQQLESDLAAQTAAAEAAAEAAQAAEEAAAEAKAQAAAQAKAAAEQAAEQKKQEAEQKAQEEKQRKAVQQAQQAVQRAEQKLATDAAATPAGPVQDDLRELDQAIQHLEQALGASGSSGSGTGSGTQGGSGSGSSNGSGSGSSSGTGSGSSSGTGSGSASGSGSSSGSSSGSASSSDSGSTSQSGSGQTSTTSAGASGGGQTITSETIAADEAQIVSAEAALAVAQSKLSFATLTSPISGTVAAVGLSKGTAVSAGSTTSVISVIGGDGWLVTASVGVTTVQSLAVGQKATVAVSGTDGLAGEISSIGFLNSSSDSSSPSYEVTITLDDKAAKLLNGAVAQATVAVASAKNVLTVPTSAVHKGTGGSATVQVLKDGKAVTTRVTLGAEGVDRTAITDGLTKGDVVILADLDSTVTSDSTTTTNRFSRFTGGTGAFTGGGTGALGGLGG